jgi:hypothetical protein
VLAGDRVTDIDQLEQTIRDGYLAASYDGLTGDEQRRVQEGYEALRDLAALADADREALIAMVYVHPCQCGDGIPKGMCARCRAVKALGFDPAAISAGDGGGA